MRVQNHCAMRFPCISLVSNNGFRVALLLLFLVSATILQDTKCHAALLDSEKDALRELLFAFPALANIPIAVRTAFTDLSPGGSWPSDFTNVCTNGDGYELFGIRCASGHIDKIRWYALLLPVFTPVTPRSAQYLTNFPAFAHLYRCVAWRGGEMHLPSFRTFPPFQDSRS